MNNPGEVQDMDPLDDISAFIIPPPPMVTKNTADANNVTSTAGTLISNPGSGDRDVNEVKVAKVCKISFFFPRGKSLLESYKPPLIFV